MQPDNSLRKYFKTVRNSLDENLVSKEFSDCITNIAELLPPVSVSGIECRMEDGNGQVDFSILVWPTEEGMRPICDLTWASEEADVVYWKHIRSLCGKILEPESYLYSLTKSVALEFDLTEGSTVIPDPLFFVLFRAMPRLDGVRSAVLLKLIDEIPNLFSKAAKIKMANCAEILRSDRQVYGIGWMPPRTTSVIRYGVEVQNFRELMDYLRQISWPGDTGELRRAFDPFMKFFTSAIVLGLDITDQVGPRIGIELRIEGSDRKSALIQFLKVCTNIGAASTQKCDGIIHWEFGQHGGSNKKVTGADENTISVERGIAYFKFVYVPNKPLRLKSYLFFRI